MTKKQNTFYIALSVLIGALGGVAGTAYTLGAERQSVKDKFVAQEMQMKAVQASHKAHKEATQNELNRLVQIMVSQNTAIQQGITSLNKTVAGLRGDVQVLNALVARLEQQPPNQSSSN